MNALVWRLALGLALGASVSGALAAAHQEKPSVYAADGPIDITGFYLPAGNPLIIGRYKLDGIFIDSAQNFRLYEQERRHSRTRAPITVSFSEFVPAEGDKTDDAPYVLARSFHVDNESIDFDGYDPKLGRVTFRGKLDSAAVRAVAPDSPESDGSVLKGDLTVGGKLYRGVEFYWFSGDV